MTGETGHGTWQADCACGYQDPDLLTFSPAWRRGLRAPKYPVIVEDVRSGKRYKVSDVSARLGLRKGA